MDLRTFNFDERCSGIRFFFISKHPTTILIIIQTPNYVSSILEGRRDNTTKVGILMALYDDKTLTFMPGRLVKPYRKLFFEPRLRATLWNGTLS